MVEYFGKFIISIVLHNRLIVIVKMSIKVPIV